MVMGRRLEIRSRRPFGEGRESSLMAGMSGTRVRSEQSHVSFNSIMAYEVNKKACDEERDYL